MGTIAAAPCGALLPTPTTPWLHVLLAYIRASINGSLIAVVLLIGAVRVRGAAEMRPLAASSSGQTARPLAAAQGHCGVRCIPASRKIHKVQYAGVTAPVVAQYACCSAVPRVPVRGVAPRTAIAAAAAAEKGAALQPQSNPSQLPDLLRQFDCVQPAAEALILSTLLPPPSAVEQLTVAPITAFNGTVKLPGSKSLSNRILLLAALAEGTTLVRNLLVRRP